MGVFKELFYLDSWFLPLDSDSGDTWV